MDKLLDLKEAERAKRELELKYEVKNTKKTHTRYQDRESEGKG